MLIPIPLHWKHVSMETFLLQIKPRSCKKEQSSTNDNSGMNLVFFKHIESWNLMFCPIRAIPYKRFAAISLFIYIQSLCLWHDLLNKMRRICKLVFFSLSNRQYFRLTEFVFYYVFIILVWIYTKVQV